MKRALLLFCASLMACAPLEKTVRTERGPWQRLNIARVERCGLGSSAKAAGVLLPWSSLLERPSRIVKSAHSAVRPARAPVRAEARAARGMVWCAVTVLLRRHSERVTSKRTSWPAAEFEPLETNEARHAFDTVEDDDRIRRAGKLGSATLQQR